MFAACGELILGPSSRDIPRDAESKPAARINFACVMAKLVAVAYDLKKTVLLASSVHVPMRRSWQEERTGFFSARCVLWLVLR